MYGRGYPQAKFTLDAKKMHKSKGKSCGYYWRIIFLFSSLIQSLIIVSLVLFMVYGHPEQSSEEERVQDLQKSFMKLTTENKALHQVKSNFTRQLNITLTKKQKDDLDLLKLRKLANVSTAAILNLSNKLFTCESDKRRMTTSVACTGLPAGIDRKASLTSFLLADASGNMVSQLQAMYKLLHTNFTQTVYHLTRELAVASQARDSLRLETIILRRNTTDLQRQLDAYSRKCKGDFIQSLDGIQKVTRAFIDRINGLIPAVLPFQLTCEKQQEQLQQIRTNCSRLSHQVEDKFQSYLDSVGAQVSHIQAQSSHLLVQNLRLQEDKHWCQQNRSAEETQSKMRREEAQVKHDQEVERLLKEQRKLRDERELQRQTIIVQSSQIHSLNMTLRTCIPKPSPPKLPWTQTYLIPGSTANKPGATFPAVGGTAKNILERAKTGVPGVGVVVPGQGASFYSDVQKHLKELQELANKDSGVSG